MGNMVGTPMCARCRNHNVEKPVRGHMRKCKFKDCDCMECNWVFERQLLLCQRHQENDSKEGPQLSHEIDSGLDLLDLNVDKEERKRLSRVVEWFKTCFKKELARTFASPSSLRSSHAQILASNYLSRQIFPGLGGVNGMKDRTSRTFSGQSVATENQTLPPPISAAEQHLATQQHAYAMQVYRLSRIQPGVTFSFTFALPKSLPSMTSNVTKR